MKLYADTLPENCKDCEIRNGCSLYCGLSATLAKISNAYAGYEKRPDDCPISLLDTPKECVPIDLGDDIFECNQCKGPLSDYPEFENYCSECGAKITRGAK